MPILQRHPEMRVLHDFAKDESGARALAILLPGALQQPEDFIEAGFAAAVRKRGLPLDLALLDFGLEFIGQAADGSCLPLLDEQVMQAQWHRKYQHVWLVGISIGAVIAIDYADRYPGRVDGLCLLAPYPGNRMTTGEIAAAGGLRLWLPGAVADNDAERRVWRWLKARRGQTAGVRIHLGFGREDRFAAGHRLMAQAQIADSVDTVAGGHAWPVWRALWDNFLDQGALFSAQRGAQ